MMIQTDVLIVGGGFAGVSAAQALEKQSVSTTLVDQKDYFEVTFATLRSVAAPHKTQNKARKKYQDFLSGRFIQGRVQEMSSESALLADGRSVHFSQAIIASGSRYPSLALAKSHSAMDIASRNEELLGLYKTLKAAKKVLIIGGGGVGVELAGEIAHAMPALQVTLAHKSAHLLDQFKPKTRETALTQLQKLGVKLALNCHYQAEGDQYVDRNTGHVCQADVVFEATGTQPNSEFLKKHLSGILDEYGHVRVNDHLEVVGHGNLYALGDVANVGEAKLGYLAQGQGTYIAKLIVKKRHGKRWKPYKRNPLMALIPVGQKMGVVQLPFVTTTLQLLVNLKQKDLFIRKMYKAFGATPNLQ